MLQKMETQDVMDYELFDLNGKNYCPIDGTISLKEFVDNEDRHYQGRGSLDRFSEEMRSIGIGQILQPGRGIDNVHNLSFSLWISGSNPFNKPRSSTTLRTGKNSTRPLYSITCSFIPGLNPNRALTDRGMTT